MYLVCICWFYSCV